MPEAFQFLLRVLDENLLPLTFVAALIDATGIPFPGRLLLIVAGTQAGPVAEVAGVVLCAAAGALLGDHVLFLIGAWAGDRAVAFYCRLTGRRHACQESLRLRLRRASVPALILGRFTFAVRAVAATMAGSGVIPYRRFLLAEIAGAAVWATGWVLLGWTAGPPAATFLERHGLLVGAATLVVILGGLALVMRATPTSRAPAR